MKQEQSERDGNGMDETDATQESMGLPTTLASLRFPSVLYVPSVPFSSHPTHV
jgi:hypothetical protein